MIEVCHVSHVRKAVIIMLDDDSNKLPRGPEETVDPGILLDPLYQVFDFLATVLCAVPGYRCSMFGHDRL